VKTRYINSRLGDVRSWYSEGSPQTKSRYDIYSREKYRFETQNKNLISGTIFSVQQACFDMQHYIAVRISYAAVRPRDGRQNEACY
jgi:hypothetical protein